MKILLLGSTGMAGSMIKKYLNFNMDCPTRNEFNPLTMDIPNLNKYDYVINCIGQIKQKQCDEEIFYKINSEFPIKLANKNNKVIHISSDCVFSGNLSQDKSYSSEDIPDATDIYGMSKIKGESPALMVLRTSIIGPSKDNFGLFEWFKNSSNVNGFNNHLWSGITTLELAKIINDVIINNKYEHKLLQIASDKICKYDLLCEINNVFNMNKIITEVEDDISINRSLISQIKVKPIRKQLIELKEFI